MDDHVTALERTSTNVISAAIVAVPGGSQHLNAESAQKSLIPSCVHLRVSSNMWHSDGRCRSWTGRRGWKIVGKSVEDLEEFARSRCSVR